MMTKKESFNNITPLPSFIPRDLALDILHSHSEIITLNPLVLSHRAIPAPRDAPSDEYYSTWYEISERVQVVPGAGRLGGSKISFRACFHDVPWGVQTHVYAPMGIDLRHNYRIAGTQPGEPAEFRELGINAPSTGLYLREDVEIRCNFAMVGFVKGQLKTATKVLVDRLIKKAELLDAGVLHGLVEHGRLRTVNPADRSSLQPPPASPMLSSPPSSPGLPRSPSSQRYRETSRPGTSGSGSANHPDDYQQLHQGQRWSNPVKLSPDRTFTSELPGDTSFYHEIPSSLTVGRGTARDSLQSTVSHPSASGWSYASSMSSGTTNYSAVNNNNVHDDKNNGPGRQMSTTSTGAPYVRVDEHNNHGSVKQHFAAELPVMAETREEAQRRKS